MDALIDSSKGNCLCNSIQDVQDRLHSLLLSKSSDTRAEHTSLTFELRYNTVFYLNPDAENNVNDSTVQSHQNHHQPVARSVTASETVQNQPTDDPHLQRIVAKHIVSAIGSLDSSSWTVRQVSRGAQGWTFTYICSDSLQAWTRANAKNSEKPAIAAYSGQGGLDSVNACKIVCSIVA